MSNPEVIWHRLNETRLKQVIDRAGTETQWVMDTETNGLEVRGPDAKHYAWWIGLMPLGGQHCFIVSRDEYEEWGLEEVFTRLRFVGHNLRFDFHALDLIPVEPWWDTLLPLYYKNTAGRKSMDHVAAVYGWPNIPTPALLKQGRIAEVPEQDLCEYLANDLLVSSLMAQKFGAKQRDEDWRTEQALLRMENRGLRLIPERLAAVEAEVDASILALEDELAAAGIDADTVRSPMKVGEWLMANGRTLPRTKKTKRPSTNALTMNRLIEGGDALVATIVEHRKTLKLRSSFTLPLAAKARDGILYPETRSTMTVTGRFSCADPNLQQIPKRGPVGKAIRQCMTSPDNTGIIACDYSQVELRVAAALANEPVLLEAFAAGRCPHREVAAVMLSKRPDQITDEERFGAKAVNFGILNGMGAKRLAIELKVHKAKAQRFLDDYLTNLHHLNEWMGGVWQEAAAYFIVRNEGGRTRVFGGNDDTRPGISMRVQGTAAEIMRKALVAVEGAGHEPLLSVHDEVLTGGVSATKAQAVQEVMEEAANSAFPEALGAVRFTAEATTGPTWGDA